VVGLRGRIALGICAAAAAVGLGLVWAFADGNGGEGSPAATVAEPEPGVELPVVQRPEFITEAQWELVQDGKVSDDEMRGAVQATIECARELGTELLMQPPPFAGAVPFRFGFAAVDEERSQAIEDCRWTHMYAAEQLYERQWSDREFASREQVDGFVVDCLESKGLSAEEIARLRQGGSPQKKDAAPFRECFQKSAETFVPVDESAASDARFAYVGSCLAESGVELPAPADRPVPFWTAARLNELAARGEIEPAWTLCELFGHLALLAPVRQVR
jgi:hypothetical protein